MEKAWLVGIRFHETRQSGCGPAEVKDDVTLHLDELEALLDTLEVKSAGRTVAPVKKPSAALLLGSGKTDEIIAQAKEAEADLIVFDENLSPTQQRNWGKGVRVKGDRQTGSNY